MDRGLRGPEVIPGSNSPVQVSDRRTQQLSGRGRLNIVVTIGCSTAVIASALTRLARLQINDRAGTRSDPAQFQQLRAVLGATLNRVHIPTGPQRRRHRSQLSPTLGV